MSAQHPTEAELDAARALGRTDRRYARQALSAYSTTGARAAMRQMARRVLEVEGDPDERLIDELADAYWAGF